jgi:hypothetical protein
VLLAAWDLHIGCSKSVRVRIRWWNRLAIPGADPREVQHHDQHHTHGEQGDEELDDAGGQGA